VHDTTNSFLTKFSYDLTIGTSDKGIAIGEIEDESLSFKHALVVFGGVMGLNPALENDNSLNVDDPALLFDHYVNTVPGQGVFAFLITFSGTIFISPLKFERLFNRKTDNLKKF
jgi:hypothetical protein